jgi:hypothetical protein
VHLKPHINQVVEPCSFFVSESIRTFVRNCSVNRGQAYKPVDFQKKDTVENAKMQTTHITASRSLPVRSNSQSFHQMSMSKEAGGADVQISGLAILTRKKPA